MKALVWIGNGKIELKNIKIPIPAEDEVLIKVHSAGICGTDIHILEGKHPRGKKPPIVLGHEMSGWVFDKIDDKNDSIKVGDRIVIEPTIPCGRCYSCKKGSREVCLNLNLYGVDRQGGFAEYLVVNKTAIHKIPQSLNLRVAALTEPTAVAVHAIRRSFYKTGDSVCVIGGGPIGSFIALVLHLSGCKNLLVIEPQKFRRNILKSLGINTTVPHDNIHSYNIAMKDLFDVVFDTAGVQSAIDTAIFICRPQGNIIIIALPNRDMRWNNSKIVFKEISVIGSRVYAIFDFDRAISILNNNSKIFKNLIFPVFKLYEGRKAFEFAKNGNESMRVLFDVSQDMKKN